MTKKILSTGSKHLHGVPQGSVLGSLLFTSQHSSIISGHGLSHHLFADKLQFTSAHCSPGARFW